MSTQFDRELYGYRFAEILFEDSLQTIAARELGDASRWAELISYNDLVPPFIVQDAADARPGVLAAGSLILVPAPAPVINSTSDPDRVFERDLALGNDGQLLTDGGDFSVLDGRQNLKQALRLRVITERGELIFHPQYGSSIRRLLGTVNGPTAGLLAAQYASSAIKADERISRVIKSKADVQGDTIHLTVEAETVAGRTVVLSVSI